MFSTDDTIVAISTPLGRGAIGIVRLSGPEARRIGGALIRRGEPLVARHATTATLSAHDGASSIADEVVVTFFQGPHSYTGEDVVEISAHGSPVVLKGIVEACLALGARLAEPGEFTLRAFLNAKLDLIQAEAVRDLIEAATPLQARAAFDQLEGTLTNKIGQIEASLFDVIARLEASLDFPEEGYHFVAPNAAQAEIRQISAAVDALLSAAGRGRLIREGAQVAIVGTPNVGKSSLFNTLISANRAIVSAIPGTTRDLLTERVDIHGIAASLVDTAGIRETTDVIEREGVLRARGAATVADLTLVVLDRSRALDSSDRHLLSIEATGRRLIVANKIDLPRAWDPSAIDATVVEVSATTGAGIDTLVERMATMLGEGAEWRDQPLVSNVRHTTLLQAARAALGRAEESLGRDGASVPEEFVLADLQEAAALLQEITGQRTTEDLLSHIFANFCIGK